MNKYKVTGSLTNSSDQILIDANGNMEIGAGVVKTALQVTGFTGSIWSVSGSIDEGSWESISSNNTVGSAVVLLDTSKYNDLRINISSHTGNAYNLYRKLVDSSIVPAQITGSGDFFVDGTVYGKTEHLVLSSSAGSVVYISGNLQVGEEILYKTPTAHYPTGATQTIDWSVSSAQYLNLFSASADVALTMSNPQNGASYLLHIEQADGPFRDINWASSSYGVKWAGGTIPTITAASGAFDLVTLYYDGVSYYVSIGQNFS